MTPQKRITPAGRYPSKLVIDGKGEVVLLVDGPNLITMHIIAKGTPAQRRAERLASIGADDNRVSFGCINVPPAFFKTVLDPDVRATKGIVYILPEKTTPGQMFGFQPAPVTAPLTTPVTAAVATPVTAPVAVQAPGVAAAPQMSPQAVQAPSAPAFGGTTAGAAAISQ